MRLVETHLKKFAKKELLMKLQYFLKGSLIANELAPKER